MPWRGRWGVGTVGVMLRCGNGARRCSSRGNDAKGIDGGLWKSLLVLLAVVFGQLVVD